MRSGGRSKVDAESTELRDFQKSTARMHVDELEIDEVLVRRLLAEQFPEWAEVTQVVVSYAAPAWTKEARLSHDQIDRFSRILAAAFPAK